MKRMVRLLSLFAVLLILVSCATSQAPVAKDNTKETEEVIEHSLFDAWNDSTLPNSAVTKLVKQADKMIEYKQWGDAQEKLARTLRLSSGYAPAWSRLSWLSLRAAKLNKSIRLAYRSNSYTETRALKILNWSFIRNAYQLMGNETQANAAKDMLLHLRENLGDTR